MSSRLTNVTMAGVLGLGGLVTGVVLAPALATAATTNESAATAVGNRVDRIKEALSGLVKDGTITQSQADKVATTLDQKLPQRGPGMHGVRGLHMALDVAASTLGMTEADLVSELHSGKSLADVAGEKKVSVDTLQKALVKAAEDRLAQAVKDGKITQAQADTIKANLPERVSDAITHKGFPGRGHHGMGPGMMDGDEDDATPPTAPPSTGSGNQPSSYRVA